MNLFLLPQNNNFPSKCKSSVRRMNIANTIDNVFLNKPEKKKELNKLCKHALREEIRLSKSYWLDMIGTDIIHWYITLIPGLKLSSLDWGLQDLVNQEGVNSIVRFYAQ